MSKNKKGISLVVLVVTIIVIIILLVTVLYNITDGKLFGVANESVFKNDLRVIEEEFEMFVQTKAAQSVGKFEIESLNAADNGLTYNTKTNENEKDIYDVIPTAKKGYYSEFEIIKGELYYKGDVEQKLIWAKELGIGIIPYEIVDGVLISANSNLLLLDSTGTVRIPYNVTKIDSGVFNNLEGLTRVIIPGSVKEIGKNAFSNNTSLQEVIMEDGVEIIGEYAFLRCSNLTTIKLSNTIKELKNGCFSYCSKLSNINLPNSITNIETQSFTDCNSIISINLPENLTTISQEVFSGCKNLEYINIPSSIKTIETGAFSGCTKLNNLDVSKNDYFSFENNCLYSKDFKTLLGAIGSPTSITINTLTEKIEHNAFNGYTSIKEIYIPASVKTIGSEMAFGTHKIDKIVVDSKNQYFTCLDNDLYSINYEVLYKCNKTGDIDIKEGVKEIKRGAFITNGVVTSIDLPESLEAITGLSTIPSSINYLYLPKNVKNISSSSIIFVENIEVSEENQTFTLLNDKYLVDKAQKRLYWVKKDVEYIDDLPNSIETIESRAISYCPSLKNVILPNGVKILNSSIFQSCNKLTRVEIPSSIETMSSATFRSANNLTEIIIHKKRGEVAGEPWGAVYGTRVITYDE